MSIEADAGAELDIGGLIVSGLADIKLSVDKLEKRMHRLQQLEESYQFGVTPVEILRDGRVDAAGDNLFIDLGGPGVGRKWELRRLIVGGITWSTVAAGTANLTMAASRQQADALTNMVDQAPSLPDPAFYGSGEVVVVNPNHLWVAIIGGTAGQQYACTGFALSFPNTPQRGVTEE